LSGACHWQKFKLSSDFHFRFNFSSENSVLKYFPGVDQYKCKQFLLFFSCRIHKTRDLFFKK
jgi:hypothetical protein